MNSKILDYINKCEKWKVEIKENHWAANSLSQHELCDDIASSISDFEDLVSEVEQSISGKFKNGDLKPDKAEKIELKAFVEEVISSSQDFLKDLEGMGENYIGIKSECESFIGDMQRKLYLVNFTLKEELKERLKAKINESMPKNLSRHDEVDKFMGRKPKSIKARINQIYRIVKKYGIDSKVYHDENWQAISDYYRAISSLGCEVEMKPCGHISNIDSIQSDGGYCDYAEDGMPRSKQYAIKIMFEDGMAIDGYIKCMAAGTMEDPFSRYDTCIVLWPKNNRMLENKENMSNIKLTEAELKQVIKEAAMKVLSETPLNYDIDNFSGRWNKDIPNDYIDGESEGYFDDPNRKSDIESDLDDYASEEGDMRPMKDIENDYSWGLYDNQPIAQSPESEYAMSTKAGVPFDTNKAISMRNRQGDWSDRELRHGNRVMDKYVHGKYDGADVGDAWDDLHYESKKPMKVTESELKDILREATMKLIKEYGENVTNYIKRSHGRAKKTGNPILDRQEREKYQDRQFAKQRKQVEKAAKLQEEGSDIEIKPSKKGTFTAAATKHGESVQGFANKVLKNKDNYSPAMVKKANFAKNFGGKKK